MFVLQELWGDLLSKYFLDEDIPENNLKYEILREIGSNISWTAKDIQLKDKYIDDIFQKLEKIMIIKIKRSFGNLNMPIGRKELQSTFHHQEDAMKYLAICGEISKMKEQF